MRNHAIILNGLAHQSSGVRGGQPHQILGEQVQRLQVENARLGAEVERVAEQKGELEKAILKKRKSSKG